MSLRTCQLAKCATLALILALGACDGMVPGGGDVEQAVEQERASALARGVGGAGGSGSFDSLTTYTARCEAATGIHVPTFDCTKGVEVPQGTSFDPLAGETGEGIPAGIAGSRVTSPPAPVPPDPPTSLVQVISGGGRDIGVGGASGGAIDEFFYVHQGHSGAGQVEPASGTVEVQVTALTNPDPGAKAGLMLRRDSTSNSAFFMVGITAAKTVFFQSRTAAGAPAVTLATKPNINFPVWLRLMWDNVPDPVNPPPGYVTKNRVAAQYSINHVDWLPVYDQTFDEILDAGGGGVPFPFQGLVGLAVTAHKAAPATATATFDKFSTTKTCDRPNVLNGFCDPRSRFQVLAQTSDAIVVGNCRKEGAIDDSVYKDVAVIQYNRQNGAICFYQAPPANNVATNVTTPSLGSTGAGVFPWISPAATRQVGCTACHDNGPFIRSPYLYQLAAFPKDSVYGNSHNKLRYVGRDFAADHSWWIDGKSTASNPDPLLAPGDKFGDCNSCHTLSVNDVNGTANDGKGTSLYFAGIATAPQQQSKNPHSSGAPIWMRPDWAFVPPDPVYKPYVYFDPAAQSAGLFRSCGTTLSNASFNVNDPNVLASNCLYTPNGAAYGSLLNSTTEASLGGVTGSASGTLEFSTLTAAANTDLAGTTDKGYWTYSYVPGDGSAYVKVTALDACDPNAKAALTVRDGPNPDAINATVGITANSTSKSAFFQYRLTTTGATVTTPSVDLTAKAYPFWLRLDRTGQTFVGYVSWDGGDSWTQVGTAATVTNLSTSDYGLVVSSKHASQTARATFESFEWSSANGWNHPGDAHILVDARIGAGVSGTRKEQITTETITSSGGDIANNSDQFMYAFKGMIGEGTAITRVLSQTVPTPPAGQQPDPYAKAGLMFREDAGPGAANVFLGKMPSGATIQQRKLPTPATVVTNVSQPAVPTWLRLVRTNNTFIGSMSSDGTNWTQVGDPVVFTNFSWAAMVGLAVSSHGSGTVQAVFDNGLAMSPEPPGFQWFQGQQTTWYDASMGMPGGSHTTQTTPTLLETVTASGADIYNYSDQFFYAWQNVTGNATIVARVESLAPATGTTGINDYAKAGVMFRDSATGGAPNAFAAITATKGGTFQNRINPGDLTATPAFVTTTGGRTVNAPFWVKVTRSGAAKNLFSGFVSYDNGASGWTPVGAPTTINNIGQTALVGLAVTSHDAAKSVTARFSNVSITLQP